MRLDRLLPRDNCIPCPSTPPVCNCGPSQTCFQIAQGCTQCASFKCVDNPPPSSGSHGPSAGAIAGAVVGSLIFLGLAFGFFLWWRRRNAVPVEPEAPEMKDIPAPADTVLNRPDPTEKVVVVPTPERTPPASVVRVYENSNSIIDLDPASRSTPSGRESIQSNPFGDGHSIRTTSTGSQATNVIPIAFVPPPASMLPGPAASQAGSPAPPRSQLAPGVDLNMDHVNFSAESVPASQHLAVMDDGQSYITNASFASDVLSEAPTIVTGRQVVSAARAAVVSASTTKSLASRPSIRSPLTASSFGPQDVLHEVEENPPLPIPADPFADHHRSPAMRSSMATHGSSQGHQDWSPTVPQHPWNAGPEVTESDRPMSTYTQAASVIGADIMDATRVHLGFAQPLSASFVPATPMASSISSGPRTLVRMASGRLVTPSTAGLANPLERQQERALAEAQAQVQQSEKSPSLAHRMSMSTMASGMSGRADSILESFTFVPPSPISNRPPRTPPRSPLAAETPGVPTARPEPAPTQDDGDLEPPNRRILGMSTGSQISAISTGLGSFPFQIDHGSEAGHSFDEPPVPTVPNGKSPTEIKGKQRASLDTLALTSDLSSYPLGFDRQSKESFSAFMANKRDARP
ncbi:hypothetical protein BC834DRAFT_825421 [Gloeopeniophorella convolvens]|nr:hypothetical protein BC834DRAFT_825421 [Gloeopeniophorella convolvens]